MMTISGMIEHWLGICPKLPVARTVQEGIDEKLGTAHEGRPDGGAGRLKPIQRGFWAAMSGTRTLIRNRQLLWFSLLIGLVLTGHFIAQWVLSTHPYSIQWPFYVDSTFAYVFASFVLTFTVEFPTVFCLVFLLAGLVLSLSFENSNPVSFFHGLTIAREYLKPLTGWSIIVALSGTLLFTAGQYSDLLSTGTQPFTMIPALWSALWNLAYQVLDQAPFNYIFYHPDFYLLPPGDAWGIQWVFKSAFTQTLILSLINLFLFVLTLFVVPLLVLEGKTLKDAIFGSFTLMKNILGEVATCVLGLGMVVFAVSLTYLFFPAITRILAQDITWRAGDEWIAAGSLYLLALAGFVVIVATVGGIAARDLYIFGKTGQLPVSAETEQLV